MNRITRPRASGVSPLENYNILVTFDNGEKRIFDVKPYLEYPAYKELKINALFRTVKPAGLSIEWIHGQDICPDELYFNSVPVDKSDKNQNIN